MTATNGEVPFAVDGQSLSAVEQASESVGGPLTLETVLLVMGLAVVIVGVMGLLSYLYSARTEVEREIREVEAEQEAFLAFAERIEGLSVDRSPGTAMATPQTVQTFDSTGPPVVEVADAFSETVMAVPHYEETYGSDVVTQMASELDADLVESLQGRGTMSEPVKQGLAQRAKAAARKRGDLLEALKAERKALAEQESSLESVKDGLRNMNDRPLGELEYDKLRERYDRLDELEERLETALRRRQRTIHAVVRTDRIADGPVTLQEYLYDGSGPRYPVLDAGTRLDRLIGTARRRLRKALWSKA